MFKNKLKNKKILPYLFISPFFLVYFTFGLYPFISGFILSLQRNGEFSGFENYIRVFQDGRFWKSIKNASLYAGGSVFIILSIALVIALMINSDRIGKSKSAISTIFFIPNVTSVIVLGIVFRFILKTNNGVINHLLTSIGILQKNIRFLSDPKWAVVSMIIIGCWRFFGVNSLYFLSGLQGIPNEIKEAAKTDGANPWQEFWKIKLPMLKPIIRFIVFTAITGSFALFGEVYTLTGGQTGSRDSMLYPVLYLYNTMFKDYDINIAATIGYLIALILLVITSIQRYLLREKG